MPAGEDYFKGVDDSRRGPHDFVWPQRTVVDVGAAVQDAYARVDSLHDDMQHTQGILQEEGEEDDTSDMYGAKYEELVRESQEPSFY